MDTCATSAALSPLPACTEALLALVACGGPVAPRRALLDQAGDPADALAMDAAAWRAAGLDAAQCAQLRRPDDAALEPARAWLRRPGHHVIGWHAPDYPALLRRSPAPPLALFVAGEPALLWHPMVAVVGSRGATAAGCELAATFARAFTAAGFAVGSGLAAGIDTAAHAATLAAGGLTLAVLGTGPDVVYPASNRALHARIETAGVLVSEHLPGTGPRKEHFPSRNRILAALSLGTVVIEAAERSGALITARQASEAGREVFAVPGSVLNPLARGCHRLIREGAALVESPQEVLAALGPVAQELAADLRRRLAVPAADATPRAGASPVQPAVAPADEGQSKLLKALGFSPASLDDLAERTRLTPATLSSMLLAMELDGLVEAQHGRYCRVR